jgi:hypothetical protein
MRFEIRLSNMVDASLREDLGLRLSRLEPMTAEDRRRLPDL